MTYNNLTNEVTSVSGSWTVGGTFSYTSLNLQSGIPHKDQLEVERIFTLPTSASVTPGPVTVNIKDNISTHDLHRIFIVNKDDYTVNETTKVIATLTPSVAPNTRTYTFEKGTLAGKTYTIPTITSGEAIVVRRKTVSNTSYVSWSAGSRLTSQQLNLQVNQLLKLTQELIYKLESEYLRSSDISGSSAPAFTIGNDLDMGGTNKIINLANPTTAFGSDTTSAVNKGFIESHYVNLDQNQAQSINGAKTFTSAAVFQNTLTADSTLTATSTLTVSGLTTLNGGLTMDGGVFTVANTTGNTGIGGTLNVTGATVLSSTLSAGATTLASASVTGALTAGSLAVDTTTLVVDAANDRVGIGTVSPAVDLHVLKTSGATSIRSHSTDTGESAGVFALGDTAQIDIATYGSTSTSTLFGRSRANLTRVYSVNSSGLAIGTNNAQPIVFGTNGVSRLVIGANSPGIQFPALSSDVNTLDAYLEGTHTIANTDFRGDTIAGSHTLGEKTITYTRIGNRLFFNLDLSTTNCSVNGSGHAKIINLPFNLAETWFTIDYYVNLLTPVLAFSGQWLGTEISFYASGVNSQTIPAYPIDSFRTTSKQTFIIRASGSGQII